MKNVEIHSRRAQHAFRYFSQCRSRAREAQPSIAPKALIDIRHIRQNPDIHSTNCQERNYIERTHHPYKIAELFTQWRESRFDAGSLRKKANDIRRDMLKKTSKDSLIDEAREVKDVLSGVQTLEADLESRIAALAEALPNLTSPETPKREAPPVVGYINEDKESAADLGKPNSSRDHVRLGKELDLLDFSGAATTSGWGWYYLKNEAVLLEQALIQYSMSIAMKHGFKLVTPPSMVYSHIASACGFRPRDQNDEQQIYNIQQREKDLEKNKPSHSLAGTAEIPLAGMKANEIIPYKDLPLKVVGPSRCYRAEAGARGADTKGLYRVHEFTKVEMFAWTAPGAENKIFESMLKIQTEILQGLGLRCRIIEMPSPDLGASAFRKRDIEAYFPSRSELNDGWGEVTSTSICTDYQTRRLNTRMKTRAGEESSMRFPSTVNGTAMAVPRIVAALLEYGYEENDDEVVVNIPQVLWPWMHGVQAIRREKPR